jgi:hypothetical protein
MRSIILAMAVLAIANTAAHAGEPQSTFRTTAAKSHVPVTPKLTISRANRAAGMRFKTDGSIRTRKLPSGQTVGDAKKAVGR